MDEYTITFKRQHLIALAVIAIALGVFFGLSRQKGGLSPHEIEEIKAATNLAAQTDWYLKLIKRVGPAQAQEELYRSGLPFTGQTHLLNHTVGDYLYEKYKAAGLALCQDYFLASCYHGFVLRDIETEGIPGTIKIMNECQKSGPGVVAQCAHAIGHGFLAYNGYQQLPESLKLCDEVAAQSPNFPLFNCQDGVFMENIWGVHEGAPSVDRWVKPEDPTYPCSDPKIDESYRNACWSNQPALLYQLFNRDLGRVGEECEKLKNKTYQQTCFNGLARQIHPIAAGNLDRTFELCSSNPPEWVAYCLNTNAVSAFSVGDRLLPYQICARVPESDKSGCYYPLFSTMVAYSRDSNEHKSFCDKVLEDAWRQKCYPKEN